MSLYIMIGLDNAPHQMALRDSIRAQHREYVVGNASKIRLGGATIDGDKNQNGTVLVFEANSADEVWDWIKKEPFYNAGVFASVEVREWNVVMGAIAPAKS